MRWESVKLASLIESPITGEWGDGEGDVKVIRTTNFRNDGRLDLSDVVTRSISYKKVDSKKLKIGDIIIEKSGGSPTQPVGRVVFFEESDTFLCNNFTSILRPKENVYPRYLFWKLFSGHQRGKSLQYQNKTTGIINLKLERYISELEIPLPPLTIQKKISDALDRADALRRKDQELLVKYEELAKSIFYDMFGDLQKDYFILVPLFEIASITSGITKNSRLITNEYFDAPYLRVANVQDGFLDLSEIKTIKVLKKDMLQYNLQKGDIVITEGGDPDKLGRGAVWNDEINGCTFQNHIFRIRVQNPIITPFFLSKVLGSPYGKSYFLKAAKQTTGIASINSSQLKKFPVKIPPIELQIEFEKKLNQINKVKQNSLDANKSSTLLFDSLLSMYFK